MRSVPLVSSTAAHCWRKRIGLGRCSKLWDERIQANLRPAPYFATVRSATSQAEPTRSTSSMLATCVGPRFGSRGGPGPEFVGIKDVDRGDTIAFPSRGDRIEVGPNFEYVGIQSDARAEHLKPVHRLYPPGCFRPHSSGWWQRAVGMQPKGNWASEAEVPRRFGRRRTRDFS